MTVVLLARYPLKSARAELLDAADLDLTGISGDRGWACLDAGDGTIGSAKHPRRWERLLEVGATLDPDGTSVDVHLSGCSSAAGSEAADRLLSEHLGFAVRLTDEPPADPRLHRELPTDPGMVPEWMTDIGPGGEAVTPVSGVGRVGRFVDFGAIHLVTTGELDRLGGHLDGTPVSALGFRPNLVIDAPADPPVGSELRVGEAVLRILLPTPRCVVPGLAHGAAPADRRLLTALARHYRVSVPGLGRAACFGSYAEVVRGGEVRLGSQATWYSQSRSGRSARACLAL